MRDSNQGENDPPAVTLLGTKHSPIHTSIPNTFPLTLGGSSMASLPLVALAAHEAQMLESLSSHAWEVWERSVVQ